MMWHITLIYNGMNELEWNAPFLNYFSSIPNQKYLIKGKSLRLK